MDRNHKVAIILLGFAWPAAGLGFLALQFGYLPSGLNLIAQAVGLFFSGVLSGFLYLGVGVDHPDHDCDLQQQRHRSRIGPDGYAGNRGQGDR